MNLEQASKIPITWFYGGIITLEKAYTKGDNILCCSPFREDKSPSFSISVTKNITHDFGTDEVRGLVQSVQDYYCLRNTSEALQKIEELLRVYPVGTNIDVSNGSANNTTQNQQKVPFNGFDSEKQSGTKNEGKNKGEGFKTENGEVDILEVKDLYYFPIKNYIKDVRKISIETAKLYQKEIYFKMKGKRYFGIAHQNEAGGYEISGCGNNRFKCAINKDISFFKGSDKNSKTVLIFEGIFDFMSYLESKGVRQNKNDVIVLNSCALWRRGVEFVENQRSLLDKQGSFERVEMYLDNDKAGKETGEKMKIALNDLVDIGGGESKKYDVLDKSSLYTGFKDMGEWREERK